MQPSIPFHPRPTSAEGGTPSSWDASKHGKTPMTSRVMHYFDQIIGPGTKIDFKSKKDEMQELLHKGMGKHLPLVTFLKTYPEVSRYKRKKASNDHHCQIKKKNHQQSS